MPEVPFARFEPDKNRYNIGALPVVDNVVPQPDGWGPLSGPVEVESVYDFLATPDAVYILTDGDGNDLIIGRLYVERLLDENDAILTDEDDLDLFGNSSGFGPITGSMELPDTATGLFSARKMDGTEAIYAGTDTALYEFNLDQFAWEDIGDTYNSAVRWAYAPFGSEIFVQNGADPEQIINIETGAVTVNSSAPVAKYMAVFGAYLVRLNIAGFPRRFQHSGTENPRSNTATVNNSDYIDIPEGDEGMGLVPLTGGGHVIMRSAIQAMLLTDGTGGKIFRRVVVDGSRGTPSPYSICSIGQDDYVAYFDDGFTRYKGGGFANIGEGRVNNWFLSDCPADERANILAALDPEHKVVWFCYTDGDGVKKSLGYQYAQNEWCLATGVSFAAATKARTFAYTESEPPIVEGDAPRFAFIGDSRVLAYQVGDNLAAVLSTNEVSFAPDRSIVTRAALIGDATDYTITGSTTDTRGGAFRERAAALVSPRSGSVPMRQDGRTHKLRLNIDANVDWSTAIALDVEAKKTGKA